MEKVEILVYSRDDPTVLLDVLNARIKPKYLEEIRGPGGGSVEVSMHDPKIRANPDLLAYRNVIVVREGGVTEGGFILTKKQSNIIEKSPGDETYELSGESLRGWFNDAQVRPSGALRRNSAESRAFNFATEQGDWYDADQWVAPTNVVNWGDVEGSPWRYAPAEWPDAPDAKWIWSSNSIASATPGDNYFRYEFTAAALTKYSFFFAAAEQYAVYIDGQMQVSTEPGSVAWSEVTRVDMDLEAGDHVLGVRVNTSGGPAALLSAVFTFGDPEVPSSATLISTTGETGWLVAAYPDPVPGWSPGEIVLTLMAEAEARGVLFPTWLTPTFTSTEDSYGNAWDTSLDWDFKVGDSLAEVVERLEELSCDLWIDPTNLELNMAVERGIDRSIYRYLEDGVTVDTHPLVFAKGKNLLKASIDGFGEIKNSLLLKTSEGWIVSDDTGDSSTNYGVIEGTLDTGLSESVSEAVASYVFEQKANPEEGASYEILPTAGHVPFKDFHVGDWVLAPNDRGLLVKRRVVSLSLTENKETGHPVYTVEFDTIFRDNEDRLSRFLAKTAGGSLSVQFANSGGGSNQFPGRVYVPPAGAPIAKFPKAPAGLGATSEGQWDARGVEAFSEVTLTWTAVLENTDDTATVPQAYEVWGKLTAAADSTYRLLAVVFTNTAVLRPYAPESDWSFKVRARNRPNELSAFSAVVEHTMEGPDTALSPPDAPTLSSDQGILIVEWDGLIGGVAPLKQFRYAYITVSPTELGTYTRTGSVFTGAGTVAIAGLNIGTEYWVKMHAVDGSGIVSAASTAVSHTITGVDLSELDGVADAVAAAQAASEQALSSTNLLGDPSFELTTEDFWSLETADVTKVTTTPRTDGRVLRVAASTSEYDASIYQSAIPVDEGQFFRIAAWVRAEGAGAGAEGGLEIRVNYGATEATMSSFDEIAVSASDLGSTYVLIGDVWAVPSGARYAQPVIHCADTGDTNVYLVDDVRMLQMTSETLLVNGSVVADKLAAESVVAGKLAADSVAASNIQAEAVTAGKIAANAVTANEIAANAVTANKISAGAIETYHIAAGVGQELDISSNESVNIIVASVDSVATDLSATDAELAELGTYYQFGVDGATISSPGSTYELGLNSDGIEIRELGVVVSYWNAGQMTVRSFVGEEVILGNHQIVKYSDDTVVRAL